MLATIFATAERMEVISKGEWNSANRCRQFLKLMSVADITTGDGAEIEINYLKWVRQSGSTRAVDWPTQGQPSKQDCTAWSQVLRLALGCGNKYALKTKLGAWLEPYANKTLPHQHWFLNTHNNNLHQKMHNHW